MNTITIDVDLAKVLFATCEVDGPGHVLRRQDLRREPFGLWLAQQPADTVVAMEACSGAHPWARRCLEYGLEPRIIAAQFVKSFGKGRKTKNDRADAVAIANKHARQIWAMLAHDMDYDPHACLNHPMHQQTHAAHVAWTESFVSTSARSGRQRFRPTRREPD